MSTSVTYRLARRRVLAIDDVADELMRNHKEATRASQVEDLVLEATNEVEEIKRFADEFKDGLRIDSDTEAIIGAHTAAFLLATTDRTAMKVERLAAACRRQGYAIEGFEKLQSLRREMSKLGEDLKKKWLLPDEQKIRRSRQQLAAGDFRVI